uniref:Uncharacterized protein n=1 Tax=Odontella aurita TaxID=265563 RepID=A0A6U6IGE4_9STRA|mmetsp:Transcript_52293/g.156948  ORF Transcript_52293/g.156948 Transcript_52293/m.156948 type:complete len:130 (+) Transcript_52293:725-1114(+)|eukprot:CAMPEP_0113566894 /NCGR_PEP_ID=MMETSP0015_2-20120614/22975_1 /TAXON_ID=2838 /ORGANISM="Odontella" /LENGTH=129 /DNA_ID=CAMNT_0000469231 /DNA_START=621 /DNA_END=1010 /DNA_ORIENTATION=+ /assembly_acc=CAM_ASM_000160
MPSWRATTECGFRSDADADVTIGGAELLVRSARQGPNFGTCVMTPHDWVRESDVWLRLDAGDGSHVDHRPIHLSWHSESEATSGHPSLPSNDGANLLVWLGGHFFPCKCLIDTRISQLGRTNRTRRQRA